MLSPAYRSYALGLLVVVNVFNFLDRQILSILLEPIKRDLRLSDTAPVVVHMLSLTPFRRIVKDYFLICDNYYRAIRTATPSHIEAIDMGRRGLHNEGSELLMERLKEKIEIDFDTARRLFTLVCVLHWKG